MHPTRFRLAALLLILGLEARPTAADGPTPAGESAGRMTVPEGFKVTLFAAEPDVRQPIAFAIDARGRLWVAENYSYPNWRTKPEGKDRILIFEDSDGDGRFDSRKVFWEGGTDVTSVAVGFGGGRGCSPPDPPFFPGRGADDPPGGPPRGKPPGLGTPAQHHLLKR